MTASGLAVVGTNPAELDRVTTRFVSYANPDDNALAHATKIAGACGLEAAPLPLLVLTGADEQAALDTYRAWVEARHPELADPVDAYLRLLPLRNVGASVHGTEVIDGGTTLRIVGTCRRGGTDGAEPDGRAVRLHLLDASGQVRLAVETHPQRRFEDGATRWTGFTADVPLDRLPVGSSLIALELAAPEGHSDVRTPARASVGMLAASRPIWSAGVRFQLLPTPGSDRVELVARRGASVLSRLGWGLSLTLRDARDLVRRRPFAWVRPVRLLTRPFYAGRPIWLVGERPDTARDNGFHLFAHLRTERPDIRAYYVIDRDGEQHDRVAGLGRVIAHSSWRHRLLMLHADVLANAYSIKHMAPRQWDSRAYMRQFTWRVGSYRVYLKHGINVNTKALRRRVGGYDLYLTASEAETVAARATSGYDRQIVQTGLPRYDALVPTPPSRTVLFMPTWRLYLAAKLFGDDESGDVPFEGSVYQRFVVGFLTSPRLHELLERHDFRLQFMPHYNLREHLADVTVGGERITVLDGAAAEIQEVMRACDLFVTDHSSVHFDLAYLGTPIVYSHFDADEYRAGHADASWFDHDRDGFGPVTHDLESTLDAIEDYLSNDCRREDLYSERAEHAFAFHDRDNSRRTVAAIEELLRTHGMR